MINNITINNVSSQVMVVIPCVLMVAGVIHQLNARPEFKNSINIIKDIHAAYDEVLKTPHSTIILNVSKSSQRLSDEVKFIKWYRKAKPNKNIVIYTHNHKVNILKYISSLGVRVVISQYESPSIFMELLIKSLSSGITLHSPMIKTVLQEQIPAELTECEMQVIEQLFLGRNVTQVAKRLGRDIRTVSSHKRHAMEKLGFHCDKDLHVFRCELTGN
ncbi:LuxR C-terminal-related transcriptional regulator [Buttiauxella massiliensis]|uniref:LuxR C-terminal-related transcriptional regulator n=1 Tax=Buttiauxella massiliensis TaxID=2831590 RepID=UPI00125FC05A|nr:LuxR C-terminal-related transcriptional regulator [Buttiauxella massiliensis]